MMTRLLLLLVLFPGCRWFRDKEEVRAARREKAEQTASKEEKQEAAHNEDREGGDEKKKGKSRKKGDHSALHDPKTSGPLGSPAGTLSLDATRAAAGVRLVVSGHGPELVEIGLDGQVQRTWTLPPEHRKPGDPAGFRRAVPLADGGVAALIQGKAIVRLRADGTVAWRLDGAFHHGLDAMPDGSLVALQYEPQMLNNMAKDHPTLVDQAVWISPEGKPGKKSSLLGALVRSAHWSLMPATDVPDGDVMRTSSLDVIDKAGADPAFAVGNLILTVPVIDAVLVFDPNTETFPWALVGAPLKAPQDARLTSQGLLVLDNQTGPSSARLFNPVDRRELRAFSGSPAVPFSTPSAGAAHLLANGNLLLVSSHEGRALELTPDNQVVWTWQSPLPAPGAPLQTALLADLVPLDR